MNCQNYQEAILEVLKRKHKETIPGLISPFSLFDELECLYRENPVEFIDAVARLLRASLVCATVKMPTFSDPLFQAIQTFYIWETVGDILWFLKKCDIRDPNIMQVIREIAESGKVPPGHEAYREIQEYLA